MKFYASTIILAIFIFFAGCATASYKLAPEGQLPLDLQEGDLTQHFLFEELSRSYGNSDRHERAKIKYLLDVARTSGWEFDRNGYVYSAEKTAKHLTKKYRQRIQKIKTARSFIENVASVSSESGRDYYALPGNGLAYPTGEILTYKLNQLEKFLNQKARRQYIK